MLSKAMAKELNRQLNLEFYSSNIYLQMSSWCEFKALSGCAAFMHKQAQEELEHMQKFFKYLGESGEMALVGALEAPPKEFVSFEKILHKSLEHEKVVTRSIHSIYELALKEKDHATANFLQWFIEEQHEEETQFQTLIDQFKLACADGKSLFIFDRHMAELAKSKS